MGNGRSFTRNRKGSPGKSRRKNLQRQRAQEQAQAAVQSAVSSVIEATSEALESAIKTAAESLAVVSGGTLDAQEAEELLTTVSNAYAREADG